MLPKLKQIEGFVTSSNKSPFPTSSCIDRCHVNYGVSYYISEGGFLGIKMHSLIKTWNVINVTIPITGCYTMHGRMCWIVRLNNFIKTIQIP